MGLDALGECGGFGRGWVVRVLCVGVEATQTTTCTTVDTVARAWLAKVVVNNREENAKHGRAGISGAGLCLKLRCECNASHAVLKLGTSKCTAPSHMFDKLWMMAPFTSDPCLPPRKIHV